jgi:hypothetical protein
MGQRTLAFTKQMLRVFNLEEVEEIDHLVTMLDLQFLEARKWIAVSLTNKTIASTSRSPPRTWELTRREELGEGGLSVDHDGWMLARARWEHTAVGWELGHARRAGWPWAAASGRGRAGWPRRLPHRASHGPPRRLSCHGRVDRAAEGASPWTQATGRAQGCNIPESTNTPECYWTTLLTSVYKISTASPLQNSIKEGATVYKHVSWQKNILSIIKRLAKES